MAEGTQASGGYEIIPSTCHHMDALFGELHAVLWFDGTMVHHKLSKDAGIHCWWMDPRADGAVPCSHAAVHCLQEKRRAGRCLFAGWL